MTRESAIVNASIRWLWAHGCFVYRQNTGAYKPEGTNRFIRYGTPGGSDIVGITKNGRAIFVECKAGKNKLSHLQEEFKRHIEDHNGIYIVAYSLDDLESRKQDILTAYYPPRPADGYQPDHRVKPSNSRQVAFDEATL